MQNAASVVNYTESALLHNLLWQKCWSNLCWR